jgi:hypothetical protein
MSINNALEELGKYREKHFEMGSRVISADGGNLYALDILVVATLNRSLCLLKGFIELIQARNFVAAAPLIRLQLDNSLRLSAGTLVSDPHKFAMNVLEGVPVNKQKDMLNQKMTDSYLVEKLSERYSWVKDVYANTSGYIHLSDKHFLNAMEPGPGNGNYDIRLKITDKDEFLNDNIYLDAISGFQRSTDILFDYVYSWAYTKDNPEKAAQYSRQENSSGKQRRG